MTSPTNKEADQIASMFHIERQDLMAAMDPEEKTRVEVLDGYTLILAVPTMISGMYGMNVDGRWMPLARTAHGFGIIGLLIVVICVILTWFLHKKKML